METAIEKFIGGVGVAEPSKLLLQTYGDSRQVVACDKSQAGWARDLLREMLDSAYAVPHAIAPESIM